jgi:hypothetical protein
MDEKTIQQLIDACQFAGDAIFWGQFTDEAMHQCYAAIEAAKAARISPASEVEQLQAEVDRLRNICRDACEALMAEEGSVVEEVMGSRLLYPELGEVYELLRTAAIAESGSDPVISHVEECLP